MIRDFFVTLLLAGIFAGLLHPPYEKLVRLFHEHRALASICIVLLFVLAVVIPLLAFLGVVAGQALDISRSAAPWIERQIREPDRLYEWLRNLPGSEYVDAYRDEILKRLGVMAGDIGNFVVRGLSAATTGTVSFLFQFFIFLYALFFFLMDGDRLLRKILSYMPLSIKDENRLIGKFTSVTRATIRGTLVVGIVQGGMAGVGFAVAGIGGSVFWGTVMVVLSIIPGIGTALVWIPASIYLLAVGKVLAGVLLAIYCAVIVGSVDNLLRPRLVGKDTKMPDLMILVGTLGGILLFGVVGFILGPVVAALFITVWDIYGHAFEFALAEKPSAGSRRRPHPQADRPRSHEVPPPDRGGKPDGRAKDDKRQPGTRRRRSGGGRRRSNKRGDDRNPGRG
jgi:predicted PurR-regulated permease PerM